MWALLSFRFFSLTILCLLLAGTWIELDRKDGERAPLPIYLDGSESLQLNRPGWEGTEATDQAFSTILQELEHRQIPFEIHRFARSLDPSIEDSLWKSATRFDSVIQHLSERSDRPPAALILSDGLDTHREIDELPPFSSLPPLYTISFGASQSQPDLVLEEILLPNPVNLHQRTRLWVRASRSRMSPQSATIQLQIDEQPQPPISIDFLGQDSVVTQSIPVQFQDTGRAVVDVQLSVHQAEWSTTNNQWREERDVLDRRTVIWHVATSIHPDIRWVREQLRMDRQMNIHPVNLFEESVELPEVSPDLIVLHGDPHTGSWPPRLLHYLEQTGVIWLSGRRGVATFGNGEILQPPARPRLSTRGPWQRPLSSIADEQAENDLLEPFRAWMNEASTPLWIHTEAWETAASTHTIWMHGDPSVPFLIYQEVGNRRYMLVTASGWHRYAYSLRDQEVELASELFSSIVQWAVPDKRELDSEEEYSRTNGSDWIRRMREDHPSGRDDHLLQHLSTESGGVWRPLDESDRVNEWYNSLEQQVEMNRWTRIRIHLTSSPLWYLLVLILLGSEWTLRRRFRMP